MQVPELPAGAVDEGALPAAAPVRVTVYLSPTADRLAALDQFLADLQTVSSPNYKAWLSPAEFGARFGATAVQVAAVRELAQSAGMTVESVAPSGLRLVLSGTAAQMEAAFAPELHGFLVDGKRYVASGAVASVPASLAGTVIALGGLTTLPTARPLTLAGSEGPAVADDMLAAVAAAVEANRSQVLSLSTAACLEDVDAATQAALRLTLKQASAQGVTVLAATACGARGSAGFPSALAEVTAVAPAPGAVLPAAAKLTELRPPWQNAAGLPADGFRHEPDMTVPSLTALTQTVRAILAKMPASADGSPARLGNIDQTLYQLAPLAGLYTQPDGAADGTWEAATGLGAVDLAMLAKVFPYGVLADNVSITISTPGATHGQNLTFSSMVTDISGKGAGAVPTGTVTFATGSGIALGSAALVGGTASVSYSQLPAIVGAYTVVATYTGDSTYAGNSATGYFTVGGEASGLSATAAATAVGNLVAITVTDKSVSGVGTPTGTVTVVPQGTSDTKTYSGALSGANGTATATVMVPAIQAGTVTMLVNCVSGDPSFTCYTPVQALAKELQGATTTALSVTPSVPVSGQTTSFVATVSGPGTGYPAPTGNVVFDDNGAPIGSGVISGSTAQFSTATLSAAATHSFTAQYQGDNNYAASSSSAASSTSAVTTTVTVAASASTVPAGGTVTLSSVITPASLVSGAAVSGSVVFTSATQGVLCTATVASSAASCSATLTALGSQTISATYGGDANYGASSSTAPASVSVGAATALTLTVVPAASVPYGSNVTLASTVTATTPTATAPAGTVVFSVAGAMSVGYSAVLAPGTATTSTASTLIPAPTPGSYVVTATCVGSNFSCSGLSQTATLATVKATTVTTIVSTPPAPTAGQTAVLVATVASAAALNSAASAPTGTVSFYVNGTLAGTALLAGSTATFSTTFSTATGNTVSAIYTGDTNFSTSSSATLSLTAVPVPTTAVLTSNTGGGLVGSTVVLTVALTVSPTTTTPVPAAAAGTVTFYDTYNGVQSTLGTAVLAASGQFTSIAQLATSALQRGTHSVTAVFAATVLDAGSTSSVLPINMTDYGISFLPATLNLTAGSSASTVATITPYNGFAGQVVLACVPPAGAAMSCGFGSTVIAGSGTSVLTVTTTASKVAVDRSEGRRVTTAMALAGLLLGMLLPGTKRRRPLLLAVAASAVVLSGLGCTNLVDSGTSSGSTTTGTPLGTQVLSITVSGTDGITTTRHNSQFQVTVQ